MGEIENVKQRRIQRKRRGRKGREKKGRRKENDKYLEYFIVGIEYVGVGPGGADVADALSVGGQLHRALRRHSVTVTQTHHNYKIYLLKNDTKTDYDTLLNQNTISDIQTSFLETI